MNPSGEVIELSRLTRRRNCAASVAVLVLVFSVLGVFPQYLQEENEYLGNYKDIVRLQTEILATQDKIRTEQRTLIRTQNEITKLIYNKN